MKLIEFSVTNFRSITETNKINMSDFTVLVGKNNEGKSNFLYALNVAWKSIQNYKNYIINNCRNNFNGYYIWECLVYFYDLIKY